MNTKSIIKLVESAKNISDIITSEIVEMIKESAEALEAKSRNAQLKEEWFSRFKSMPSTYMVTTYRSNMKVEFETDSAVLICDKEGGDVRVASPFINENGEKMYLVRDIYRVDEYSVRRDEVTLIYRGSIENCWLRWLTSNNANLG